MKNVLDIGVKLFLEILIICLVSYVFFNLNEINRETMLIGSILTIVYFAINFITGYTNKITIKESIIVGIMGCSVGIFMYFFSLCAYALGGLEEFAIWLNMPYIVSTLPIIEYFNIDINMYYPVVLMAINSSLVIIGSYVSKMMNKIHS